MTAWVRRSGCQDLRSLTKLFCSGDQSTLQKCGHPKPPRFRGQVSAGSVWVSRGKVTEDSVELFVAWLHVSKCLHDCQRLSSDPEVACSQHKVRSLICQNRKMPPGMKRKLDRSQWERIAEEAACVTNMASEVLAIMPVSAEALQQAWQDQYVNLP